LREGPADGGERENRVRRRNGEAKKSKRRRLSTAFTAALQTQKAAISITVHFWGEKKGAVAKTSVLV